jgi:uncharacterized protein YdeI (YjbR/CyaY-like superfamily)
MSEDRKYEKQIKESNVRLVKELRETVSATLQASAAITAAGKETESKKK